MEHTINLNGFALTRQVFYNNASLEKQIRLSFTQSPFDWGYDSEKSRALTSAIIKKALNLEENETFDHRIFNTVHHVLTTQLPKGNFEARVKLKSLIDIATGVKEVKGLVHAYQFTEIKLVDTYIPMFVAFHELPYKDFILREDTAEYKYIENLDSKARIMFKKYLTNKTTRKALKNEISTTGESYSEISMEILKLEDEKGSYYHVTNGYGAGTYEGTKFNEDI